MTIERKGGDRTMENHGGDPGSRAEGDAGAPVGTPEDPPANRGPRALSYEGARALSHEGPRALSYEGVWRFTAPAADASVPQARHAVRDLLHRQGVPASDDVVQGLLLIVSELVTNAVRHAALLSPVVGVEVAVGADWVRVAVEDNHPYRPTALEADHARTGGRGLLLVREISREAGGMCDVEHTAGGGKVIWAALPLTPAARVTSPPTGPSAP